MTAGMTPARLLAALYPPPVRERWGPGLEDEIRAAGRRSWPDALLRAADLWLHPAVWPARSPAERRLRASAMAVTVTALCWFVTHVATETDDALGGTGRSAALTASTLGMAAGLALIVPLPRPAALAAFARHATVRGAPPAALAALAVAVVHTSGPTAGHTAGVPGWARGAVLACWWTALALGALQCCRLVTVLGADAVVAPRPARLRLGVLVLLAATAADAGAVLAHVAGAGPDPSAALAGAALALLAPLLLTPLRDLRRATT
ncbi:hypothetical protein [Actinomadura rayongensis]|uniref:Uncharacterized protein n=1 Tax=Actinomadura rayongensis TaxID=1429076 RepID=A0A6I4W9R9_9ACTN|nr:hypothetical protein [Actinomadura rayongensis]MXQ63814.1 hypothetical protein [Actinomadura rayongensis]